MKIEGYKSVYIVGDIHGEFRKLVFDITYKFKISDSVIIIAGDCGIGFNKIGYYNWLYSKISKRLENRNNLILCVRGNHDDPSYFANRIIDYPRLKLIPDYTILEILGKDILCIGGASSTDQEWRIKYNSKMEYYGSKRRSWWEYERPDQRDLGLLPRKVDCIVSHDSPIQIDPVVTRNSSFGYDTYMNICSDREYLGKILLELKPSRWFYGHYHNSYSGSFGKTLYKGLDILEIIELKLL